MASDRNFLLTIGARQNKRMPGEFNDRLTKRPPSLAALFVIVWPHCAFTSRRDLFLVRMIDVDQSSLRKRLSHFIHIKA